MLTKLFLFAVRASSSAAHEHHKSDLEIAREYRSTLNDIPVPEGSWQENYDKRNARWNMMLGASFVFFVGTMFVVCKPFSWICDNTDFYIHRWLINMKWPFFTSTSLKLLI